MFCGHDEVNGRVATGSKAAPKDKMKMLRVVPAVIPLHWQEISGVFQGFDIILPGQGTTLVAWNWNQG